MDSNFQYASTVRWHRATDLPLPPTVKRRSAGRPPPMARPRSEAQRGSVRPAAAMRSTHREMRCSAAVQAARYRAAETRRHAGRPLPNPAGECFFAMGAFVLPLEKAKIHVHDVMRFFMCTPRP